LLLCMSEYFIVDRIEGENITIESSEGEMIIITKDDVINFPKESDVLVKKDNIFVVDYKETEERKIRIKNLMKGMWHE